MAFSTNGAGGRGLSGEINVTPLIDVLLVLLIIFMVIVPMTPHGLETALPTHQASSDTALSQPVLVDVERGEQDSVRYRVNGQITEQAELRPRLAELFARRSGRIIMLKGDSALGFGAISWVIDSGYADGAGSVELITPGLIVPGAARP